jgi:hypothetical protein
MVTYPSMYYFLAGFSGLFWTMTYLLIIYRGFKDKSYGIPMIALTLNISWEFIYSFITPAPAPQRYINIIWFLFDVVILYQFFKYWKSDYDMKSKFFYPFFALILVTNFLLVLFIQFDSLPIVGYPRGMGRAYSAFGMNLIMSIVFVFMLYQRKSIKGQSIYIALFKMIGTVFADLPFIIYAGLPGTPKATSFVFPLLYGAILIWDLIYIGMVYKQCKIEGINPFARA